MTEFVKLRDFLMYMLMLHYLHILFEKNEIWGNTLGIGISATE